MTMFVALPFVEKVAHTLDGLFLPGVESEDQLRKLIRYLNIFIWELLPGTKGYV